MRHARTRNPNGFTLIEMMAVIVIMGMVLAFGAPMLTTSKIRVLRGEAESIATSLEFARQRAVMTGIPHRLLVDLEQGGYRVEWLPPEDNPFAAAGFGGDGLEDPYASEQSHPRPPKRQEREYSPIANRELGSFTWIDEALYFVGLESPSGWIESGDIAIVFQADGTTEYSRLEIADADDNHMTLEIEPILDRVRRRTGKARE